MSLREVRINFVSGNYIQTNMSATSTDPEIREYYKIGSELNVGRYGDDYMETISSVVILK